MYIIKENVLAVVKTVDKGWVIIFKEGIPLNNVDPTYAENLAVSLQNNTPLKPNETRDLLVETREKIKLKYVCVYRDGGTKEYSESGKMSDVIYFLDNRIGSKTKGALFDKYPSDANAKMLNLNDFELL